MKDGAWIKNTLQFYKYLIRILRDTIHKPPNDDELHPDGDEQQLPDPSHYLPFVGKIFLIIQAFINSGHRFAAFRLVIVLKSLHGGWVPRLKFDDSPMIHKNIDSIVRVYIAGEPAPSPIRNSGNTSHPHRLSLDWVAIPDTAKKIHWRFPGAVHILEEAYRRSLKNDFCKTRQESGSCFHMLSVDLLEWLQQKAWSAKRYHVFLAVGALLPAELAERIFEFTLAAEELPYEPVIKLRVKLGSNRNKTDEQPVHCQNCGLPHHEDRTRESYRCSYMKHKF